MTFEEARPFLERTHWGVVTTHQPDGAAQTKIENGDLCVEILDDPKRSLGVRGGFDFVTLQQQEITKALKEFRVVIDDESPLSEWIGAHTADLSAFSFM